MTRPMILVHFEHFKETFPFRALEWLLAVFMIGWGLILLHPDYNPAGTTWGSGLFVTIPHELFGRACLVVGLIRFTALLINGMWWRTPFARLITTFAANLLWVCIVFGLVSSDTLNTGWAIYPACVIAELYNAFRSADDSVKSWRSRKAARLGRTG